ncbi:MAG: helix-turn-helix transcriptional regulator [Dehalococcoidia bacterium]|nr:helix-turn-helix transcriptional regulator [Dehalococcoidia bacterium]
MPTTGLDWKIKRIRAGLTLKEAAARAGISRRMLVYFESGERMLAPDKQAKLNQIYAAQRAKAS